MTDNTSAKSDGSDLTDQLPVPEKTDASGVESIKDPGEYALRRRLEQILNARERVVDARNDAEGKYSASDFIHQEDCWQQRHGHVGQAVHEYACEVEPLILRSDDLETEWPDSAPWNSLTHYIDRMGHVPGDSPAAATGSSRNPEGKLYPPNTSYSMLVYRYLNKCLAEMGLDAQFDAGRTKSRY